MWVSIRTTVLPAGWFLLMNSVAEQPLTALKVLFHRRVERGVNAFGAALIVVHCLCNYALATSFHLAISVSFETRYLFLMFAGGQENCLLRVEET